MPALRREIARDHRRMANPLQLVRPAYREFRATTGRTRLIVTSRTVAQIVEELPVQRVPDYRRRCAPERIANAGQPRSQPCPTLISTAPRSRLARPNPLCSRRFAARPRLQYLSDAQPQDTRASCSKLELEADRLCRPVSDCRLRLRQHRCLDPAGPQNHCPSCRRRPGPSRNLIPRCRLTTTLRAYGGPSAPDLASRR